MFLPWIGITRRTPLRPGQRDQKSGVSGVTQLPGETRQLALAVSPHGGNAAEAARRSRPLPLRIPLAADRNTSLGRASEK